MMSPAHIEKDINRNEHLKLNLEDKHLINCCLFLQIESFSLRVKSLIYLNGYGNLYR